MATFFQTLFTVFYLLIKRPWMVLALLIVIPTITLISGKLYQISDRHESRGAIAVKGGAFKESYPTPKYLDQGWANSDSLWFYNTTQGSALLPYDFFLVLEQKKSTDLFRNDINIDKYRYLPQQESRFNPDALPVGFVKEEYQDKDYIGYSCAACHTGQINYTNKEKGRIAIRIDGGPAMADMVGFLTALEDAMQATLDQSDKKQRFIKKVLALDNDYDDAQELIASLQEWTTTIHIYNSLNQSNTEYGYARLDAFGRIYNRVLQHIINKEHFYQALSSVLAKPGKPLLSKSQINKVLAGVGKFIISKQDFRHILERLVSTAPGFPGLTQSQMQTVRNTVFNEPDAPVSYPFLWDIAQSDYVQWNGVAHNYGVGPIGRNTGEVIGVFAILDWYSEKPWWKFSLSAMLTDQFRKEQEINFQSSADLVNLRRLESHLKSLQSPQWPEDDLIPIDKPKAARGKLIYDAYCVSCHKIIKRDNWDRLAVSHMSELDFIGTDRKAAHNAATFTGKSGNLTLTTQSVPVGKIILLEDAPVVQILTAVTTGVIATPDADKFRIRQWIDRIYTLGVSFFGNKIPNTIKAGNYKSDTTAQPYNSLLAYKARPLNGIWATAPYLHNGSVPTLYDLLLPKKTDRDYKKDEYRPDHFIVGSREFDPVKVGFRSKKYAGTAFNTELEGNHNTGHEYGAGKTLQLNGDKLPALSPKQRWELVEYLKQL